MEGDRGIGFPVCGGSLGLVTGGFACAPDGCSGECNPTVEGGSLTLCWVDGRQGLSVDVPVVPG